MWPGPACCGRLLVLLTNDGVLPWDPAESRSNGPGPATVAVIGPASDDVRLLQGDYHYPAHPEIVYGNQSADDAGLLPQAGGAVLLPAFPAVDHPIGRDPAAVDGTGTTVRHERDATSPARTGGGIAAAVAAAADADPVVCCVGDVWPGARLHRRRGPRRGRPGSGPGCSST